MIPAVVNQGDHALRLFFPLDAGAIDHDIIQYHADYMLRIFPDASDGDVIDVS